MDAYQVGKLFPHEEYCTGREMNMHNTLQLFFRVEHIKIEAVFFLAAPQPAYVMQADRPQTLYFFS